MAMRRPRLAVGSTAWIEAERDSALQIVQAEVDEFSFSARNDFEWLNEHMATIFSDNEINVTEVFKSPVKLRGRTPATTRRANLTDSRMPLANVPIDHNKAYTQRLQDRINLLGQAPVKVGRPTKSNPFGGPEFVVSKSLGPTEASVPELTVSDGPSPVSSRASSPEPSAAAQESQDAAKDTVASQRQHIEQSDNSHVETARSDSSSGAASARDRETSPKPASTVAEPQQAATPPQQQTTRLLAAAKSPLASFYLGDLAASTTPKDSPRTPLAYQSPLKPAVTFSQQTERVTTPPRQQTKIPVAPKSPFARALDAGELTVPSTPRTPASPRPQNRSPARSPMLAPRDNTHVGDLNALSTLRLSSDPSLALAPPQRSITPPPRQPSSIPMAVSRSPLMKPSDGEPVVPSTPRTPATPATPNRSPTRSPVRIPRESPLKHVQNKLSSIIRGSKGLLAGSAALASESKMSLLLPPSKLDLRVGPSTESLAPVPSFVPLPPLKLDAPLYPDLSTHLDLQPPLSARIGSPERPVNKALPPAEREKEDRRKEKEDKRKEREAGRLAEQMGKLERARENEREKARVFMQQEQEKRLASQRASQMASQRTVGAAPASPRKEVARARTYSAASPRPKEREGTQVVAPAPVPVSAPVPAPTTTPAPTKFAPGSSIPMPTPAPIEIEEMGLDNNDDDDNDNNDYDDGDVHMEDGPSGVPAPSHSNNTGSQAARPREIKRPIRPSKEAANKLKQAPTVIRVNMGSQHTQRSQFRPSNSTLATNLHETLAPPAVQATPQVSRQAGKPVAPMTLKSKTSAPNLKSSMSSSITRPESLVLAAKKKAEEEEAAQRKREYKLELERKRAALHEEQRRQEQEQRRQEQEKRMAEQRQKQRERQEAERQRQRDQEEAEARKMAQRQAMLEKAKQTRAPPPVARSHPNGPPDYSLGGGVGAGAGAGGPRELPRPPSRLGGLHRPQDDHSRPVNAVLSKSAHKRTLTQLTHDGEMHAQSRSGPMYHGKDAKRRRTSDEFGGDGVEPSEPLPKIKGAPIRPSSGLKKDLASKSVFAHAPPSRDLFKTSIGGQYHLGQSKAGHPLDITQMSKGPIPFATSANPHKTPARTATINAAMSAVKSAAKSAARPSPKFPNGDAIELPEIQTDDDDEDSDGEDGGGSGRKQHNVADWAESPDLRRVLMQQESVDPHQIFGPPAPLIMEEVFSKSKDRWNKFRARTSSANWSGADKLTEDEIRRDLQARDKIRREGGWSYDMSRDLM